MNSFMCRLTGGHKYDDSKLETEQIPDDVRRVWVYNRCVKCGQVSVAIMDINHAIQADKKMNNK